MTTDCQLDENSHRHNDQKDSSSGNDKHTKELTGAMNMVKRDRFELLSAYLDGEVTAAERRQVEEWLANDPTVQHLYTRLLKLRLGMRAIPVPQTQSPEETVEQVLTRIRQRSKIAWVCGGAAVAACVIGAVSALLPTSLGTPQLAQTQSIEQAQKTPSSVTSPLMVAINNPVIPIPKAAEATPETRVDQVQPTDADMEKDIN